MPCSYGGPTPEELERAKRNDDIMARLACDRCKNLEFHSIPIPNWAQEWWTVHKASDLAREQREHQAIAAQSQRNEALAKLNAADRAALGI